MRQNLLNKLKFSLARMISRRNVYFPVKFSHYFLRSIPKYVMQVKTCLFHWSCIFHRQFLVFLANNSNLNERVRILSSVNNRQRIRDQNIDVWRRQTEVTDLRHSKHFIINQFERRYEQTNSAVRFWLASQKFPRKLSNLAAISDRY